MANENLSVKESQQLSSANDGKAQQASPITEPNFLKLALQEKLKSMMAVQGEYYFPCVPTMLNEYVEQIHALLKVLGQNVTPEILENLRQLIEKGLLEGYRLSPHARLVVSYKPADDTKGLASGITVNTKVIVESLADKYQKWPQIRKEPLFGSHPDAKVMAVASELGNPANTPIIDVGAGTGRNTLPLARLGHPVDAIEITPIFAETLSAAAVSESLAVKVTQGDVLDPLLRMKPAYYKLAIASEVLSHFRYTDQVRLFLAKMCDVLRSGGLLLFSVFLAVDEYQPDNFVREMSEISWSFIITRNELQSAMDGLPLQLLSDESVVEYEQHHLPKEAWPPTSWYLNWATGRDLFPISQIPPMELRWILLQRR